MLDTAVTLDDLRSPPGNRLEALVGPEDVEIVDYH
jgi:plasmid maintenance system killer protein